MSEENKDSYFKRTYPEEWNKRIEEAKAAKAADEARFNEMGEKAAEKSYSKTKGGGGGTGVGGTAADNKMLLNPRAMKKGGKVAGKLATRGYGKAR